MCMLGNEEEIFDMIVLYIVLLMPSVFNWMEHIVKCCIKCYDCDTVGQWG